jgi:VWFA-related protein
VEPERVSRPALLAVGILALPLAALGQEPADRRGAVEERALVERVVVDAHVTGPDGGPVASLGPADFVLRVDGKPVALEAVDWLPAGTPEIDPAAIAALASTGVTAAAPDFPPGRVIVMFFQIDHEPSRLHGLLRMGLQARRFVATVQPTDRVAVVSYDARLTLRQDFSSDRARLDRAIQAAIRGGGPAASDADGHPSLAALLGSAEARQCGTPERALELVARALAPVAGGKSMLLFGWGLGTVGGLSGPNAGEQAAWTEAMHRLAEARVNVFSLDVTDADSHTLEGSIQQAADLTGGRYEKTHLFPGLVMDRVGRTISGRYVLVFVKPRAPRGEHTIDVALARGRQGRVFARRYYVD